jgi:sulfur relay (sulfurtransferase) complex TusBCD TusD component (DsrE family)
MAAYTLIASRDPFESRETTHWYDLAAGLRREGNEVTLFLVQNGVLAARKSLLSEAIEALAKNGIQVLADGFSLRERGIPAEKLADGVRIAELDVVVDHLAEGRKVVWH